MDQETLLRSDSACRTLFIAFADEYAKAAKSGRLQVWAKAVRATVEMLAMDDGLDQTVTQAGSSDLEDICRRGMEQFKRNAPELMAAMTEDLVARIP